MKELGHIPFPEQYASAGDEIVIDNSVTALEFFEEHYEKGGVVLFGTLRLFSITTPALHVWMYFILDEKNPRLVSVLPATEIEDTESLSRIPILETILHEHEVLFIVNDTMYSSLFTSTGEIALMRVRSLLNAQDAADAIALMHGSKVTDIYPVELYSHSAHKFVGAYWAAIVEDDDDKIFWYPICLDETDAIGMYPCEDLSDHPINVGESVVIGGETFIRHYSEETGTYFRKKLEFSPKQIARIQQAFQRQRPAQN